MNDYDVINAYYQLIFNNSRYFVLDYLMDETRRTIIKEWLTFNDIHLDIVDEITEGIQRDILNDNNEEDTLRHFSKNAVNQLQAFKYSENRKYQVVFFSGLDEDYEVNQIFSNLDYVRSLQSDKIRTFTNRKILFESELLFQRPYSALIKGILNIEKWPGILVFKDDRYRFIKIREPEHIEEAFEMIDNDTVFDYRFENTDSYFFHLSDLHFKNNKATEKHKLLLLSSIDQIIKKIDSSYQTKFLITGDLMNSPTVTNMYQVTSFMNLLKKRYGGKVDFVLGNHDIITHGLNLFRTQKTKIVAYLLGDSIRVIENEKIIIVKINSMVEGNFARGSVGQIQLREIDEELEAIEGLRDYTMIVMLHHHLFPIRRDEFLKQKWIDNMFIGRYIDNSKALIDSDLLLYWLKSYDAKYVFHGHRHLPSCIRHGNLTVVSAGSSAQSYVKEDQRHYLSYNILKYSHKHRKFRYCISVYEDVKKTGGQRLKVTLI